MDTLDTPRIDVAPYLGVARSLTGRGWRERIAGLGVSDHALRELTQKLALMDVAEADVVEPLGRFIAGRGITAAGLEDFVRPTLKALFPDPLSFLDMDKAVAAMMDALQARANIWIFADYDLSLIHI